VKGWRDLQTFMQETVVATKTKSQMGRDGQRKLATGAGRKKHKSGGEPQKEIKTGSFGRTGSSKQRKG